MTNNMTDDELCEAISLKREPKPDLSMSQDSTNPISGGGCWEFQPFENNGIWTPINWLSWENAGRLLEEMANDGGCPGLIFDDNSHWAVSQDGTQTLNYESPCDVATSFFVKKEQWCDSPTRAICEAWLCQ